jgi:signal transduction histidine kinase
LRAQRKDFGAMLIVHSDPSFLTTNLPTIETVAVQTAVILHNAATLQALIEHAAKSRSEAVLEERARIAREMHDSVAQMIALIGLRARTAQGLLARGDQAGAASVVASIATAADSAYVDTRDAIEDLRVGSTDDGLVAGLRAQVASFARGNTVGIGLEMKPDLECICSPGVQAQVLRVAQEALSNVRKHAQAKSVTLQLERDGANARLIVEDDGIGLPVNGAAPASTRRFGLRTMAERMTLIGGDLHVEGRPGGGTRVVARFPLGHDDDGVRDAADARRVLESAATVELTWEAHD